MWFLSNPKLSSITMPSLKVGFCVSVFLCFSWQTFLKVLLTDWLLVEPLIIFFTMTFMNTVTKSVILANNRLSFCKHQKWFLEAWQFVRQEVYLGKVQMLQPHLNPDALQAETSRFGHFCAVCKGSIPYLHLRWVHTYSAPTPGDTGYHCNINQFLNPLRPNTNMIHKLLGRKFWSEWSRE